MSVLDSILVASFVLAVVFVVLCGLYLFVEAFSLALGTLEFATRKKRLRNKA